MKSFILAMALALATTSHTFDPVRDQYSLATDHPKKPAVPDLQVGCADGTVNHGLTDKNSRRRRKRAYVPWSNQVAYPQPFQSITVWKPPVYALQRPYYVPIYGVKGKPPIYFPPQPLYVNPGTPQDNPKRFQGPQYLPPRETTTKMPIGDRFNDRPIWDLDEMTTRRPTRPIWDLGEVTTRRPSNIVPTRAPRPPGGHTPPPLIHGPPSAEGSKMEEFVPPPQAYPTRPPPTTRRPHEPSRCAWAIIYCCSTNGEIRYDCFEERGCPGAFWDNSPCDSDFAKAAIASALNYYN